MSVFQKKDYPVKWVQVGDLSVVWEDAQRGLNKRKVGRIVDDFDPDAFGVLVVTLPNGNGIYHVIDGQHRAAAVKQMWGLHENVPCLVLNAKDPKEAAVIWRKINGDRSKPQAIEDFRVAVRAGEPDQTAVNDMVRGLGYRIGFDSTDGTISAISELLSIYRRYGPVTLKDALLVIQGTWGRTRDSVHQGIIAGYANTLAKHGKNIDRKRLVDRVAKQYTPARLLGAAKSAREVFRGTVSGNVSRVLVSTYNHGLGLDKRIEEEA